MRRYSGNDIWVEAAGETGETLKLGITDYAQEKLKTVMFINLPEAGDTVAAGEKFGDVESVKTVSDLISPVDGEVVRVNEELQDEPERINEDPYACWLIEVKPARAPEGLMDEETYLAQRNG